jgi:hypothetical protein
MKNPIRGEMIQGNRKIAQELVQEGRSRKAQPSADK